MSKHKLLIIEDEPMIARIEQVNLESAGYEVAIINDGLTAWDQLSSGSDPPDLIILDMSIPYLDGFELLRRLKSDPTLASIPVVVTTARSLDTDISTALTSGATEYLTKPINPQELLRTVDAILAP